MHLLAPNFTSVYTIGESIFPKFDEPTFGKLIYYGCL